MAAPTVPLPSNSTLTLSSDKYQPRVGHSSKLPSGTHPLSPPQTPDHAPPTVHFGLEPETPISISRSVPQTYVPSSPNLHLERKRPKRKAEARKENGQSPESRWMESQKPIELEGTLQIQKDTSGRNEEFGDGVWSKVYVGYLYVSPRRLSISLLTPPTLSKSSSRIVAVKSPSRRDGREVLELEARILTYLHRDRAQSPTKNVVPFIGYQASSGSIVMEALPLTLASLTKDSLASARRKLSSSSMLDPVIGSMEWAHLAESLISGLAYLHEHRIVHGDIKPRNILLRARNVDDPFAPVDASSGPAYDAVYCDFSSSHFEQTAGSPPEVSAVTTSFTSPELLQAFYSPIGGSVSPIATRASDVYALGVTLITAAIGGDMYGGPRLMDMQRLAFARDGRPLEFARNGDQASRILKKSFVSRVIEGAIQKEASARWTASQWLETFPRLGGPGSGL